MVSVTHTVLLEAVPRIWFLKALAELRELAETSRVEHGRLVLADGAVVPDVRLVTGRHLRPGAVYRDDEETARITVRAWDRRGVRLGIDGTGPDGSVRLDCALRGLDRPRLLEVTGEAAGTGAWPSLQRARGRARLCPEDWWAALEGGRPSNGVPARVRVDHRLARAEVRAVPVRTDFDGRWEVRVTVTLRGRGLLRPLTAVVLGLAGGRIRQAVVQDLGETAAQWNEQVPQLVAQDPAELRKQLPDDLDPSG
ncbi:hypothetical protein [Streptomyces broussonetiae]|uniref:SRPBCC family protein n=1 Tax=Streptomyces broussonetiae TaxID=2686304 RepID=A0ABV5EMV6_9ACTN